MRISARARLNGFLDPGDQVEIGSDIKPIDKLKFRDSRKYKDRLTSAHKETGENDALVVIREMLKQYPWLPPPLNLNLWVVPWAR